MAVIGNSGAILHRNTGSSPVLATNAVAFCDLKLKQNNMEKIWNYVFHWNEYTKKWYAVHRDRYLDYWSTDKDDFPSDENIQNLIDKL
jgi:hypothetical protein